MSYNASSRKDIRAAEKAASEAQRSNIEFLTAAMGTVQGRVWFHDFLAACHLFADPFTGNALQEAYLKGERNVGLRVFADIIQHCPDQYIQMMRDANARQQLAATREQPRRQDGGWDVEGRRDAPDDALDPYADVDQSGLDP